MIVYAYQLTSLTSVTLLDCFTIPMVSVLSFFFLGTRYTCLHLGGIVMAMVGLVLLVFTDLSSSTAEDTHLQEQKMLGDGLTLVAATLYAVSNILQVTVSCYFPGSSIFCCFD